MKRSNSKPKQLIDKGYIAREVINYVWHFLRSVSAIFAAAFLVLAGVFYGWHFVEDKYILPVDENDLVPIEVIIQYNSSDSSIATVLEESGVIRSATAFEYYSDFGGYEYKAGLYEFNKAMTLKEIADSLAAGGAPAPVMDIRIVEGYTIQEIAERFVEKGVIEDAEAFLAKCESGEDYLNFSFIADIENDFESRHYALEGYLFPAIYEVYVGSSIDAIIIKSLNKFEDIITAEYEERMVELDMSLDEVITLASIIEKEAKPDDFTKVSSVFHNRLNDGERLESDATVQYATGIKTVLLNQGEIEVDSPYNTYKISGLPIGPICSPSKLAIQAALYPDEVFIQEGYKYFLITDPETAVLEFNKTYAEHLAAIEKWKPLWEEAYGNE